MGFVLKSFFRHEAYYSTFLRPVNRFLRLFSGFQEGSQNFSGLLERPVDPGRILSVAASGPFMLFFSIVCGLVTTAVPYIVYNFGLSSMENGKAAIIASIEPVVATLIGFFVFHETLTLGNLAGILLVLGAIAVSNLAG